MKKTNASVYWIHKQEHTDPSKEGYIGVSINAEKRMLNHYNMVVEGIHKNPHLTNAINLYGWDSLIKEIIFIGEEYECYLKEAELRPTKALGWNIAPGGHRGIGWPQGKKRSKESIEKIKKANEARKLATSLKNENKRKQRIEARNEKRAEKERIAEQKRITREHRGILREKRKINAAQERARRLNKRIQEGTPIEPLDQSNRPICSVCNKNRCSINYVRKGKTYYRSICDNCGKNKPKNKTPIYLWEKAGYRKKPHCDLCGFKSLYPSQLTVFHVDGNLNNVLFSNLKTICLNCIEVVKRKEVNWRRGDLTVDY